MATETLRFYILGNDERVACFARLGWCRDCNELVAIEHFASLADLEDLLAYRETNGPDEEDQEGAKLCQENLDVYFRRRNECLKTLIKWRRQRKSGPRCLKCASTNVADLVPIPGSGSEEFEHPGCGGVLRFQSGSLFQEESRQLLTSEGLPFRNT